jgi:hypothetical protein
MNRIGPRTILAMLLIVAVVIVWNVMGVVTGSMRCRSDLR